MLYVSSLLGNAGIFIGGVIYSIVGTVVSRPTMWLDCKFHVYKETGAIWTLVRFVLHKRCRQRSDRTRSSSIGSLGMLAISHHELGANYYTIPMYHSIPKRLVFDSYTWKVGQFGHYHHTL
jgi:hypothetical protein